MRYGCPNTNCKFHLKKDSLIKDGCYFRKCDSRRIQRYKCLNCGKRFSNSTFSLARGQKKRRVNEQVFRLLSSGVSMRRIALLLNIHRKTVKRKLLYLSLRSQCRHEKFLKCLEKSKVERMQVDDLITIEHTKLKPLSVTIAVDAERRFILGAQVSQIPAFGHLAQLSRQKYGQRKSQHKKGIDELFLRINRSVKEGALIESDEHKFYPEFVRKRFPRSEHRQYRGGRGCVAGQGELKKLHYDPLFILNHTCAMFRANINRLIRKTWCTTKKPDMLAHHLALYIEFHNSKLLKGPKHHCSGPV